jgi:hypothetical protein
VTSKQWLTNTLLVVALVAGAGAGLNYRINAFGVFGDVRGKTYRSYLNEDREAKYLFSFNYIPANFDGILLGSSISGNWDTRKIQPARTYNLSIDGANITEEKVLAENVFAREKVRLVLLCVYPHMVSNHGRKTAYMQPRDYWTALGSTQLLREYLNRILARLGRRKAIDNEFGVADYSGLEQDVDPLKVDYRLSHREELVLDETAGAEYAALLDEARAHGARIVAFIPPHYSGVWNGPDYAAFLARMNRLFHPDEKIIDFNETKYEKFRNIRENFYDGVHISGKGADFLISELNSRLLEPQVQ